MNRIRTNGLVSRFASVGLTLVLLSGMTVFGQATRGSLNGAVSDQQGAAVVGANVTARNNATGEEVKGTTGDQGIFVFPSLLPGRYSVTV